MRAVLVALLACVLTTGCALFSGPRTETCVDWVHFETPQKLFDDAALVVVGKPVGKDGTASIYGYTAQIHLVEVETVLKGQPGPGPLLIASTPATCTGGNSYPQGDPLDSRRMVHAHTGTRSRTFPGGCRAAFPPFVTAGSGAWSAGTDMAVPT